MPTHCCVPGCTKEGYREEHGSKVSYFQFPREKIVKKKWIQVIRRDEGKDFKISDSTKVCSRHFRNEDLKKTLAGKICLKPGLRYFPGFARRLARGNHRQKGKFANQWRRLPLFLDRMHLPRVWWILIWKKKWK